MLNIQQVWKDSKPQQIQNKKAEHSHYLGLAFPNDQKDWLLILTEMSEIKTSAGQWGRFHV